MREQGNISNVRQMINERLCLKKIFRAPSKKENGKYIMSGNTS
jgi:hypothetical protein